MNEHVIAENGSIDHIERNHRTPTLIQPTDIERDRWSYRPQNLIRAKPKFCRSI